MECRCYNGGIGRTRMKQLSYGKNDFAAIAMGIFLLAAVIATRFVGVIV